MPRYLIIASYTSEGAKGILAKGGTARRTAVEKSLADAGGRLESFDFAFGGEDVYAIAELPDNTTAAAFALAIGGRRAYEDPHDRPHHAGGGRRRGPAVGELHRPRLLTFADPAPRS